jgi:glucose/mannose-6-phosphate isomerase
MLGLMESLPAFVAGAARAGRDLPMPSPKGIANIVISGMGGSAIGGDVIRMVTAESLKIPMVVCRDYRLPGYIDRSTLLFASSYSGNTEETLSAYAQAKVAGASILCLTSGGRLGELARANGHPVFPLPAGLPPRAALGYSSIMLLSALVTLGLAPDMTEALQETVSILNHLVHAYGPGTPTRDNPAKTLAISLHGRIIAVYGSSEVTDPVAVRWRGQIEENAKTLAFHHVLPEMNHNELVGWEYPAAHLRGLGVVFLRDRLDHPQVQRRFGLTCEVVEKKAGAVHQVWSEGNSRLARLFSLICLGDFVSLYLAYLNEVDPTPVAIIETLKQRLGS